MKTGFFILIFALTVVWGCQNSTSKYIYNKGFVYGTMYSIVYENPKGTDLQEEITEKFHEYTERFCLRF